MENIGANNLLSIIIGVSLILTCCLTAYLFQKKLFNKYKNEVKNTISKDKKSTL